MFTQPSLPEIGGEVSVRTDCASLMESSSFTLSMVSYLEFATDKVRGHVDAIRSGLLLLIPASLSTFLRANEALTKAYFE